MIRSPRALRRREHNDARRRRSARVASSGSPQRQTKPAARAGTPRTRTKSGTSRVTTAPAATNAHAPIVTPQRIVAFAPIVAPARTGVVSKRSLRGKSARGRLTFVKVAGGPTKTPSSSRTPS